MTEAICTGCGAELQSEFPDRPGYVPSGATVREDVVCRRCFRIRNYGEFSRVEVSPDVYAEQVSHIAEHPGLVLYVLDVFDLDGSLVKNLAKYIGQSRVLVVVNKIDLVPREVKVEALDSWVRQTVERTGIVPEDILFVSAQSQSSVTEVLDAVERSGENVVYVVGMANVGKSTLLNGMLSQLGQGARFTASRVPGTTLGLTAIKVADRQEKPLALIDTPGLIHGDRVQDRLCTNCLKVAVPRARLRPKVFQLNSGQSLWIGGIIRFDFVNGPRQPVVCYVSNELVIHRTKLERAEYIGAEHLDDILKVPCASCRKEFRPSKKTAIACGRFERQVKAAGNAKVFSRSGCDIVIPGLGWITLMGHDFLGAVWAPSDVPIRLRPRLIGVLSRRTGG
jgi:30S ribosome assembly GTPase